LQASIQIDDHTDRIEPVPSIRHDFILHRSALPVETDKGAGMNCR
jgi:hypothetical protein